MSDDASGTPAPSLRAVMAGSGFGMGFLGMDYRFVEANHALAAVFGVDSLVGRALAEVSPSGARMQITARRVLETGRQLTVDENAVRMSYYRVADPGGMSLGIGVVALADPEGLRYLAKLKIEAESDGLTGLVNHRVFQERMRMEFTRAERHGRPLALAVIDVDAFKQLNDAFGHQTGDDVLQRVAGHLAAVVRVNDTVARVGGDEFALLLPETTSEAARVVVDRLHERVRRDTHRRGATDVSVSIGVCDIRHATTADDLLRYADGALYWAKASGRDGVCEYSPETVEDLSREQRGERLLRNTSLAGIRSLARAIDAKDHSTLLHSERVASLAGRLAEATGWSRSRVAALRETALIHDVGKIGIPHELLLKPGPLTPAERELMQGHALLGAVISAEVLSLEQTSWLRGHHEHFDGTGYPDGLAGSAIPDGALLLALADGWDVMTGARSYSASMTPSDAIVECQRCSGTRFAPDVVAILTRPGFERVLRMFANEQATRDRNETRVAGDTRSTLRVQCECGGEACPALLEVPASVYRAVRQADRRYLVQPGHEIPEIENTIVTTGRYLIVEKL